MFDGQRLAILRKRNGLTQQDLADILGVGINTVSKYERNKTIPSDEVKEAVAKYFDVSLDYLFCLTDHDFPIAKEHFISLPKNYPPELKTQLLYFLDLLKIKFCVK